MRRLLIALLLFSSSAGHAQDPLFSQFFAAPLQLNPAFSGSAPAPRFGSTYRLQWPTVSAAYRTFAVFYEQRIDRWNSGIGFHLENDNAGDGIYRTTSFAANYAYQVNLTGHFALKLGIQAGLRQTALDWEKLIFPDQLDPIHGPILHTDERQPENLTNNRLDLGAGLLFGNQHFWLGGSMKHLNIPDETFLLINDELNRGLPVRYTFHGGAEIPVKKSNKHQPTAFISPNFLYVRQGPYQQINVGAYAGLGPMFAGAWFRHTLTNADAAILLMGFRKGIFKIGLSYDLTVSGLGGRTGGAYELSTGFYLDELPRVKRKKPTINDCMKMFH